MGHHCPGPLRSRQCSAFGNLKSLSGGDKTHGGGFELHLPRQADADNRASLVRYLLAPAAEHQQVNLRYYDVDYADEIAILNGGASPRFAARTGNNTWGDPHLIVLPAGLRSVIEVDNTYIPGTNYVWGVRLEGLR